MKLQTFRGVSGKNLEKIRVICESYLRVLRFSASRIADWSVLLGPFEAGTTSLIGGCDGGGGITLFFQKRSGIVYVCF